MTGDEIFEWILEKLKAWEEAENLRIMSSGRGFSSVEERQVRSVEEIPPLPSRIHKGDPRPHPLPTPGPPEEPLLIEPIPGH